MTKLLVKTDKNGTKYFQEKCTCYKCNGSGIYEWGAVIDGRCSYSGVCYSCGGSGVVIVNTKEYTAEHEAKLQAQREKRAAKRAAEDARHEAERQAAIDEWKRAQAEKEAAQAAERAKSAYVGEIGQKVDMVVTLAFETSFEVNSFRGYGTAEMTIYGFKDEAGNIFVWKTGGCLCLEHRIYAENGIDFICDNEYAHKGDKIRIKASIKGHDEYKGTKQTALTRVKLVEIIERAEEATA